MILRTDMVTIDSDASRSARRWGCSLSRGAPGVPVIGVDVDEVIGVLYPGCCTTSATSAPKGLSIRSLWNPYAPPGPFIPESKKVPTTRLRQMQPRVQPSRHGRR
jgi:CBS domain containing-hemolysin-like protein